MNHKQNVYRATDLGVLIPNVMDGGVQFSWVASVRIVKMLCIHPYRLVERWCGGSRLNGRFVYSAMNLLRPQCGRSFGRGIVCLYRAPSESLLGAVVYLLYDEDTYQHPCESFTLPRQWLWMVQVNQIKTVKSDGWRPDGACRRFYMRLSRYILMRTRHSESSGQFQKLHNTPTPTLEPSTISLRCYQLWWRLENSH